MPFRNLQAFHCICSVWVRSLYSRIVYFGSLCWHKNASRLRLQNSLFRDNLNNRIAIYMTINSYYYNRDSKNCKENRKDPKRKRLEEGINIMGEKNENNTIKSAINERTQQEITISGNPGKPVGEDGEKMLERMNESHYAVTGWALEHWKIRENDRILDIGCGGGATLKRMSEQMHDGHLTGVDYSTTSLELSAKTNAEALQQGKLDLVEASVEKLPFADNTFDKIITVESFYFWPAPAENLKEVYRVLKEQGTFLLVADIYRKENLSEQVKENIQRFHLFNPTPEEFRQLLKNAGFQEIRIHFKDGEDWICAEGHK